MGRIFAAVSISAIIILIFTQPALSLKCYVCNSAKDSDCKQSPPPHKYLTECSQDTLEILNDMHRQTKLQEAAASVPLPSSPEFSSYSVAGIIQSTSHVPVEGQIEDNDDMGTPHSLKVASVIAPSHSFDKVYTNLILNSNRTARNAEMAPQNNTSAPTPGLFEGVPIPKEAKYCRKTIYHIPEQTNGPNSTLPKSERILRSCGWIHEEKPKDKSGCKMIGTEGVHMEQCVCSNKDGCNDGNHFTSLTAQYLIILAAMAAGYFHIL